MSGSKQNPYKDSERTRLWVSTAINCAFVSLISILWMFIFGPSTYLFTFILTAGLVIEGLVWVIWCRKENDFIWYALMGLVSMLVNITVLLTLLLLRHWPT